MKPHNCPEQKIDISLCRFFVWNHDHKDRLEQCNNDKNPTPLCALKEKKALYKSPENKMVERREVK